MPTEGDPRERRFSAGTVCQRCNGDVPACAEHKTVDLAFTDDDEPEYYCLECVGQYGTVLGSIIHACFFLDFVEAVNNLTEKDLEAVLAGK